MQIKLRYAFKLIPMLLILAMALPSAHLSAEIYSYVDENGVMHFSNAPTSSRYRHYSSETRFAPVYFYEGGSIHRYDPLIRKAAQRYDVPFELLKAIIRVESNFNPTAVSRAGAMGLMQIMPANVALLNVGDPFDPEENIMAGARYLRRMMEKFDDIELCLAAYNAGPGAVERYNCIPPYPETENYVSKVLKYYSVFRTAD